MALVFNGTNQIAIANLSTPIVPTASITMAVTFRTGAAVTGAAAQVVCSLSRATSYFRGYDIRLSTTGVIQIAGNGSGGDSVGPSPWSTVTATPNTLYRVVLTKDGGTGAVRLYVNALTNTYSFVNGVAFDLTRVSLGGQIGAPHSEYFGGKTVRLAVWQSVLSTADIETCLDVAQTPINCSVQPQDYWEVISSGAPTIGLNSFTLTNAPTYDSDVLSAPFIGVLNAGNPVIVGQQSIAMSLGNFTGIPTVTCTYNGGASSIPVSGTSGSNSAITFNLGDRGEGVNYPAIGTVLTFTCTNGAETALLTRALAAKPGEVTVVFVDATITDATYLTYDFNEDGYTVDGGEFVFVPYGDIVIDIDGSIEVSTAGVLNGWFRPNSGTGAGNAYFYTFNLGGVDNYTASIDISAIYRQTESPFFDGAYYNLDRP